MVISESRLASFRKAGVYSADQFLVSYHFLKLSGKKNYSLMLNDNSIGLKRD